MKVCPRCMEILPDEATHCPKDGTAARPVRDALIGKTIGGRYRLISRLGSGGMSNVYLARHVMIDRLMAIKTLRSDLAKDTVHRDRFLREARAVNRINHENIVEITDFGETDDGVVYLIMEYVPGETLTKAMGGGPMATGRALGIARQVASALGRAHQMGVIHRDLKPDNILVMRRKAKADFVKVLDFGIAKILDAPSLTGSQQIFGTPGYISPEYIQSADIDGRSDIYSLGVVLYEMVTGLLPFDYQYPGDLLVKHVTETPVAPSERHPEVPPPVEALIMRCLEKEPARRFRDAFHLREEIDRVVERLGPAASWGSMSEPHSEPCPDPRSAARDTIVDALPAGRPVTLRYGRPAIPAPPAVQGVFMAEPASGAPASPQRTAAAAQPEPAAPVASPFDPRRDGIVGARRWRRRFDAIEACLVRLDSAASPPAELRRVMEDAGYTLRRLEERSSEAVVHQREVEAVSEGARAYRAELGREIDALASEHSRQRGVFEVVVARRNALRAQREGLRKKVAKDEGAEGRADARLWELAAVEERMREQALRCDGIESRLATLRSRLHERNEASEAQMARVALSLDDEIARLEGLAASLRAPLAEAERFILEHWPRGGPDPPSRPAAAPGGAGGGEEGAAIAGPDHEGG